MLERSFSGCTSLAHEIVAADVSGYMAYTVCFEHMQAIVKGEPHTYTLRATQITGARVASGRWSTGTAMHPRPGIAAPTSRSVSVA